MNHFSRKAVAVLMLLWLPIFTGSALAASVTMQSTQGKCHETTMTHMMSNGNMAEHHQHSTAIPATPDNQNPSFNTCGVCHLACTAYLAGPTIEITTLDSPVRETTPYLVVSHTFTSVPLLPPPLVRV